MKHIYDNSNIAESFSGVTSPLTFSFARRVYAGVYPHFCSMFGVSKGDIKKNEDLFESMLTFVGFHMYYDLTNWYRLVALLPGYKFNKPFFESMLGVDTTHDWSPSPVSRFRRWFIAMPKTVAQSILMLARFIRMGSHVRQFNKTFDAMYQKWQGKDLTQLHYVQLIDMFTSLEHEFVSRWRVPIGNDLAVMISSGLLDSLSEKWGCSCFSRQKVSSDHLLLCSLDPGNELKRIGTMISRNKKLRAQILDSGDIDGLWVSITNGEFGNQIARAIIDYRAKYGTRIPNELKLEAKTLRENPSLILHLIRHHLLVSTRNQIDERQEGTPLNTACHLGPSSRHIVLSHLSRWTLRSVARREETRFRRSVMFGVAREIFIEMGIRLVSQNCIQHRDDVFYLTVEEVLEPDILVSQPLALRKLVEKRRMAQTAWRDVSMPRRITGISSPQEAERFVLQSKTRHVEADRLSGVVASPAKHGILRGEVVVMKEFDPTINVTDKILVTRHTDPGWTILFPVLRALIVERGGKLSHAAIVSREMGLPCLIGVENATSILKTGQRVVVDFEKKCLQTH